MHSSWSEKGVNHILNVFEAHKNGLAEVSFVDASISSDGSAYGIGMSLLNGSGLGKIEYHARGYVEAGGISTLDAEISAIRHAYPMGKRCEKDYVILSDSKDAVKILSEGRTSNKRLATLYLEFRNLRKKFPNIELQHINKRARRERGLRGEKTTPLNFDNMVSVLKVADNAANRIREDTAENKKHNREKGYYVGKPDKTGHYRYFLGEITWSLRPLQEYET